MATEPTPKEKFLGAMKKIITVPKSEILRREKEAKAERAKKRHRPSNSDGTARPT
jgi:hypothetical protein